MYHCERLVLGQTEETISSSGDGVQGSALVAKERPSIGRLVTVNGSARRGPGALRKLIMSSTTITRDAGTVMSSGLVPALTVDEELRHQLRAEELQVHMPSCPHLVAR